MPQIQDSNNANTGNFENIEGNIVFGNGNYLYKGHNITINGMSKKELLELLKDPEFLSFAENYSIDDNPIYRKFLYLDRIISDDLCLKCQDANPCFYFHTHNDHQPDWLFDRVVEDLKQEETPTNAYQSHRVLLGETTNFEAAKKKIRQELRLASIPETAEELLKSLENQKATHLILFSIDVTEGREPHKALGRFEKDFFAFWEVAPKDVKFKVFLSVKLRPSKSSFWGIFKRKNKKSCSFGTAFFSDDLPLIEQHDIDRFFEYQLKTTKTKVKIKKSLAIKHLWEALAPEIYYHQKI